ncbi:hypothetical protein FACS1894208_03690 [Clostridia bacterium]|nr:hypothetical protein FACS1894208_03690 [Clostridia bacterium]
MKKAIIALCVIALLTGCTAQTATVENSPAKSESPAKVVEVTDKSAVKDDDDDAKVIPVKTIDTDGEYTLTGKIDGQVLVTAENVTLILDGVTINCADGSAILGKDGNGEEIEQELTIELRGENSVTGAKHGIQGKDDLTITGTGSVNITAVKDGLHAGETLTVAGGTVNVLSSYEGMEAETIVISGGNSTVHASDDGVNAASDDEGASPMIKINGGTLTIYSGSDGIDANGTLEVTGGTTAIFVNASRDGDATDTDYGGAITPALYGSGSVKAGTKLAVGDIFSITTEADATAFCLIVPGITDGQSYKITADGAELTTVTATAEIQGMMMPGGGKQGGTRPGEMPGNFPGGNPPGGRGR